MENEMKLHGGLPLPTYWALSRNMIAVERNWGTISRNTSSGKPQRERTVEVKRANYTRQCDRNMDAVAQFLPNKPMADLSAFELLHAVQESKYANGKVYSASTLKGRLSLLRDIYDFAEDRGDACNDLSYIDDKQLRYYMKGVGLTPKERQKIFRQLAKENKSKARSLTPAQQAKLVRIILKYIEEDGRYLALAILLYTGMRPSECRGLCWYDWVPFLSHSERHMLPLSRQRDDKNQLVGRLKRPASYRKIGVHFELEEIIRRRMEFTLKHFSSFEEIASLPMCCYKNEFAQGCTSSQLSTFAAKILKKSVRVSKETMITCAQDMFAYEDDLLPKENEDGEDHQVSTYLLRHDFWTWLQASTELSAEEKRYFFGHSMVVGWVDRRPFYNDETILWDMLVKLDHMIKYLPLHELRLHRVLDLNSSLSVPNTGRCTLHLSPDLLRNGSRIVIVVQANEYDDPISVKTLSPTKTVFSAEKPLQLQAALLPHIREETFRKKINTDYDNYDIRRHTRAIKERKLRRLGRSMGRPKMIRRL